MKCKGFRGVLSIKGNGVFAGSLAPPVLANAAQRGSEQLKELADFFPGLLFGVRGGFGEKILGGDLKRVREFNQGKNRGLLFSSNIAGVDN